MSETLLLKTTADADLAALGSLLDLLEERLNAAGIKARETRRVMLATEEIFVNSITHGGIGGCRNAVDVTVVRAVEAVSALLSYPGPAFDPGHPREASQATEVIGGQGLFIVKQIASRIDYAREAGRNLVTVTIALPPD